MFLRSHRQASSLLGLRFSVPILLAGAYGACVPHAQADDSTTVCQLNDERFTELSGIAVSRRHPDCFYVHNDSGDKPRVFLVDRSGWTRLTIRLRGATHVDYEDIALAPGATAGTFDVCVADIGDNSAKRPYLVIYRFPEPALPPTDSQPATRAVRPEADVAPAAVRVRYADGPANAEAFAVHPRTGDGYIFTKRLDGWTYVYRLAAPWPAGDTPVELPCVARVQLPPALPLARVVTAADISPDGKRVALRCYVDGWEWRVPAGTPDADFTRVLDATPTLLSLPAEPQGEALGYTADGRAVLTVSEGRQPEVHETRLGGP